MKIEGIPDLYKVNDLALAKEILERPEVLTRLNREDERFGYPLMSLAKRGPVRTHHGILSERANMECKEVIDSFISAGANPNVRDSNWGNTALMWSIANGNSETALHLIGHQDVKIGIADRYSKTPLHLAVIKGYHHFDDHYKNSQHIKSIGCVIDALLQRAEGAEKFVVNARDDLGNTPLHYAVLHRDADLVRKLLNSGADAAIYNNDGSLPVDLLGVGYNDVRQILKSRSFAFTAKDEASWKSSFKDMKDIFAAAHHQESIPGHTSSVPPAKEGKEGKVMRNQMLSKLASNLSIFGSRGGKNKPPDQS